MMARYTRILTMLAAFALMAVVAAHSVPANAQTDKMESPTIAVIDMQKIMRESTAVRSIQQQIEKQRSDYQEELSKKEQELRAADEELARQRTILSSDAFKKKRQQLEQRVGKLQRNIQTRKQNLDQTYGRAIRQVQQELAKIVSEVMKNRGIDLVLTKTSVFLVHKDMEITDVALTRLNDRLTSIDVSSLQN
ncbi:OmpH family outer membrane protein [Ferruginivarius sediminum]|uniref:OmpH family outer membrane protein n=2 Tax=Ferruginivarius sediminum TaxID=2661937 RepID=A0A369T9X3_9PROT|nr:OmpH family outer membrane protein [Ferruginivarius sediminum]